MTLKHAFSRCKPLLKLFLSVIEFHRSCFLLAQLVLTTFKPGCSHLLKQNRISGSQNRSVEVCTFFIHPSHSAPHETLVRTCKGAHRNSCHHAAISRHRQRKFHFPLKAKPLSPRTSQLQVNLFGKTAF